MNADTWYRTAFILALVMRMKHSYTEVFLAVSSVLLPWIEYGRECCADRGSACSLCLVTRDRSCAASPQDHDCGTIVNILL